MLRNMTQSTFIVNLMWTFTAARYGARLVPIANTEMAPCFYNMVYIGHYIISRGMWFIWSQ